MFQIPAKKTYYHQTWWVIAVFLAIIVGVKFGASYIAVRIARMQPASTVAYGVMSKGAVDLALMLSLLEFDMGYQRNLV